MGWIAFTLITYVSVIADIMLWYSDGRVQWETLLTGIAAVIAAGLTIVKLSQQINQTEQLAADHRRRRARAARAMLPLALSEIGEYSTDCIIGSYALRLCFQDDGTFDWSRVDTTLAAWPIPRLPENVLPVLKECIEFCDDSPAESLAVLVRHFQVQNLRLAQDISWLRRNDGVHSISLTDIELRMLDAAELYARAGLLLPFARGEAVEVSEVGRHQIDNALSFASCFTNVGEIDELVDRWQFARDHPMPKPKY